MVSSSRKRNIPSPIPPFSMGGILSPLLSIPLLALVAVILLSPEDILTRYDAARRFTSIVRNTLLSFSASADIAVHASSTRYPEVALLTNSLLWALLPWNAAVYFVLGIVAYPIALQRRKALGPFTKREIHLTAFMFLFFPQWLPILTMMPGDFSFMDGITTSSRVGYAFIATTSLWLSSLAIGTMPVLLWTIIKINKTVTAAE